MEPTRNDKKWLPVSMLRRIVKYQTGVTSTGAPELKQKTLNYLRADASEQDIYAVAEALFSLAQNPVINVFLRKN